MAWGLPLLDLGAQVRKVDAPQGQGPAVELVGSGVCILGSHFGYDECKCLRKFGDLLEFSQYGVIVSMVSVGRLYFRVCVK